MWIEGRSCHRKLKVVETKSIDTIGPIQVARLLTYLRFLNLRYGVILNFNTFLMKDGFDTNFLEKRLGSRG